jgi:ferritin-like protein
MSSGYLETGLSESAADIHRALASLQEELEAVDYYNQRADRTQSADAKAILIHNRNEEMEHAAMLLEWLRRQMPDLDAAMKTYLFTTAEITTIEKAATGADKPSGDSLGIGSLRS